MPSSLCVCSGAGPLVASRSGWMGGVTVSFRLWKFIVLVRVVSFKLGAPMYTFLPR